MEGETGCKIAIRGKGSVKEGKLNAKLQPDADDDLHVLITADSEDKLTRAEQMIRDLLVPIDEQHNRHKQDQLRELAILNGTLREDENFHFIDRSVVKKEGISCKICNEVSHPTSDCPQKKLKELWPKYENEYIALMQELGESLDDDKPPQQKSLEDEYQSFMSEVANVPVIPPQNSTLQPPGISHMGPPGVPQPVLPPHLAPQYADSYYSSEQHPWM